MANFYVVDYAGGVIGFMFGSGDEAEGMRAKIMAVAPTGEDLRQIRDRKEEEKRREGGFLNKIKKVLFSDEHEEEMRKSGRVVGHEKKIQFDLTNRKIVTNEEYPPEWEEILNAINVKPRDLEKDK